MTTLSLRNGGRGRSDSSPRSRVGTLGMRGSLRSTGNQSLSQKMSFAHLDFTLHSLKFGNSFREPAPEEQDTPDEVLDQEARAAAEQSRNFPFMYSREAVDEFRDNTRIDAIQAVRFLAAIHIVVFHYYKKKDEFDDTFGSVPFIQQDLWYNYWVSWGGQWVQFFWVAGGFMMTYSRLLSNRRPESSYEVWSSTMQRLYAPFLISVVMTLYGSEERFALYYKSLPSTLTLTFSWGWSMFCTPPTKDQIGGDRWQSYNPYICVSGINEPAWYIATLQFYNILFPHVFNWIKSRSTSRVIGLLICCWLGCMVWPVLLALPTIEDQYVWGGWLATVQAYHPISHFHKFVFGMCAARIFVDLWCRPDPDQTNGKLKISETQIDRTKEGFLFAPIGWVLLVVLFFSCQYDDFLLKLIWRPLSLQEFVLVPVFTLIIVGSAFQRDPITKILNRYPFKLCADRDISYEIYILQGPVQYFLEWLFLKNDVFLVHPGDKLTMVEYQENMARYTMLIRYLFLPILVLYAFFINRYVTAPISMMMAKKPQPARVVPAPASDANA